MVVLVIVVVFDLRPLRAYDFVGRIRLVVTLLFVITAVHQKCFKQQLRQCLCICLGGCSLQKFGARFSGSEVRAALSSSGSSELSLSSVSKLGML